MIDLLGPLTVAVPGSPRQVTAAKGKEATHYTCYAVIFQALPTNVGKVYIGAAGLSRTTLAGVAAVLAVPTANFLPSFGMSVTIAPAGIDLSSLYLDVDAANDGALVTALVM